MKLKPYMLVAVSMEDGRYNVIGQTMSFSTPENTIMVRMVPGHPGTLQEIPLTRIYSVGTRRYRQVSYATVKGVGSFPEDMLRYDNAVPVNFKIERDDWRTKAIIDPAFGSDELIIATVCESGRRNDFCDARWASFLWSVKRLKTETISGDAA